MRKEQIAAQLFTVRDFAQTPADLAQALKRIKGMGFDAVQVSGIGPIADDELAAMLQGEGLTCCATHEKGLRIVEETDAVIDRLDRLNCRYTAYPHPHNPLLTRDDVVKLASELETAARRFGARGKVLAYHNHASEFVRFENRTILDLIYERAPSLQGEIDTYWIQYGGANPVTWINRLAGRLPLLHLKEFGFLRDKKITMMPIGDGNLEWPEILAAAERSGTEWYIIEQDVCLEDPFDCLRRSFDFLVENFVRVN